MAVLRLPIQTETSASLDPSVHHVNVVHDRMTPGLMHQQQQQQQQQQDPSSPSIGISSCNSNPSRHGSNASEPLNLGWKNANNSAASIHATTLSTTPVTSNLASLSFGMSGGLQSDFSTNTNHKLIGGVSASSSGTDAVLGTAQLQSKPWQYPWQRVQQQQHQNQQLLPPKHPATSAISLLGGSSRGGGGGTNNNVLGPLLATNTTKTSTTTMPLGRVVIGGGRGGREQSIKYSQRQISQQKQQNQQHQLLLPPQQQMKSLTLGTQAQVVPLNLHEEGALEEQLQQLSTSSPKVEIEDSVEEEEEVPLTTGPVTLGIHDAQTFDGVELALHPDVFAKCSINSNNCEPKEQCLLPGDLVEIRVWCVRPGMAAQASSVLQQSTSLADSVLKSKTGSTAATTRAALHSRNASLTTVISSISNTSLTNTPIQQQQQQQQSGNALVTKGLPHLPAIVGGGSTSLCESMDGNSTDSDKLFGENLLHGDIVFETPKAAPAPAITASNISSVLSDAATSLFRKIAGGGSNNDDTSVLTHSRDGSILSNSITEIAPSTTTKAIDINSNHDESMALVGMATTQPNKQIYSKERTSKLATSPPHLPLSPSSHSTMPVRTSTPPSPHSSPTKQMSTTPIPTPNPMRSKSFVAPMSTGSNAPTVRRIASASTSTEKSKAIEKLPPTLFLDSDIGAPSNPLPEASATIIASRSDPPHGQTSSYHDRHLSIMRSGGSALGVESSSGSSHRRHSTSIPATAPSLVSSSSFPAPTNLPHTTAGSIIQKGSATANASNTVNQIIALLQSTHYVRISFIMSVSEGSLSSIKSGARTKVSLLRAVADLYGITAYDTVTVTQIIRSKSSIVRQSIAADFLTVTFKDQFVSRGDMYKFQKEFINCWVYEGKRLSFNGIQTITKVIRRGDHVVRSALISEDTKLTFRSRSARIIWLVQMSSEMWEFASPFDPVGNQTSNEPSCRIYFDKFVDFVRRLFKKWKTLQLTHNLTVVFFSRTYICEQDDNNNENSPSIQVDSDGRKYVDHYKTVLENEMSAGDNQILRIKQEFVNFPKEVGWDLTHGRERFPSTASQGNVLEAINITLNLLHLHYIDRDLHRTGNSIVVITPGNGVFEIEKNLAGITKQRMMDNGIGSDMLSLGLPPLHVAPFFLYKEKGASSAEEIQGFDDWKTYFEVPHWMNLSFVDYDNYEDPTLYKEHLTDEDNFAGDNDKIGEDDKLLCQWSASNGFLKRIKRAPLAPGIQPDPRNSERHKHLISDREFDDVLQACRPRYRGEHGKGLPLSLSILIKKGSHVASRGQDISPLNTKYSNPYRAGNNPRLYHREWGAVNFDEDLNPKRLINSQQSSSRLVPESLASPSSSYTNVGSNFLFHRFSSQLQSPRSLEAAGGRLDSSRAETHSSIRMTMECDDGSKNNQRQQCSSSHTPSDIRIIMADHDNNVFCNKLENHVKHESKAQSILGDSIRHNGIESFCPVSPLLDGREIIRPHMFSKGGIEAALIQHEGMHLKREPRFPRSDVVLNRNGSPTLMGSSPPSQAVSPLRLGMTPFSLERRNEGLRFGVLKSVAPNVIPRSDAFQSSDPQRKILSQTHAKSRDDFFHYNKASGHSVTESKLLHRRKSQWDNIEPYGNKRHAQPTEIGSVGDSQRNTQTSSPQRLKMKTQVNRKPPQQQSFRHRQKSWVLNPFRQEDEEEVLAKRTHNRRRWSHVFPLGEDEFKRHAGPNWKSLCQPAILPMTIDFHPSPQDLDDQAKFSVKQYSVTLPPMNETTYMSHTELLDDLLMQRMRQDFQIVPRNILQHSRRDVTENVLEATLSMGHKIQRLSYNPSTDSVDVVQYYARFAEDETPQVYRYLLWSTLQQDFVKASQTFTKYTRPYRWNELDMLIGGDAETTILEGMRHPRISFLIIPDQFTDSKGENEYLIKFQRLVEYLGKFQQKDDTKSVSIELITSSDADPKASSGDKRFVVDLRKKREDKYEWMELVHDSNCDSRRTFRITIQWLVAVASKIDQHAKNLQRRCSQYGLKLVSVPHFSCLRSCFMNPFAVPINHLVYDKDCVNAIENALTKYFDFVYDGNHMSDPNEIECLDKFDFVANKWSIKEKKEFVASRQYLHRTGTLFTRFLRDTRGSAIIIAYLNQRHIAGDERLLWCARAVFYRVEQYITEVSKEAGCAQVVVDQS